jgi:hypothetical protein
MLIKLVNCIKMNHTQTWNFFYTLLLELKITPEENTDEVNCYVTTYKKIIQRKSSVNFKCDVFIHKFHIISFALT